MLTSGGWLLESGMILLECFLVTEYILIRSSKEVKLGLNYSLCCVI